MNMNATVIGQVIWFALFVWFCMKIVWPFIGKALEERRHAIAEGLNAADRAKRDLANAEEKVAASLDDAKAKSAELIEQANRRANQIIEEAKEKAAAEGERLVAKAQADIEQEINSAREQLRQEVAALAVAGAEQILRAEVDKGAHKQLLDQLAAEL